MTGRSRTEVRFSVYSNGSTSVGSSTPMIYDKIDFDVGLNNDNYSVSTYKYTVPVSGIYLIGYSYSKITGTSRTALIMTRNNLDTDIHVTQRQGTSTSYSTVTGCVVYKLVAGDVLYLAGRFGNPRVNLEVYTTDDIYNSFWGIRLDYNFYE